MYEGPGVHPIQDIARKVVFFYVVEELGDLGIGRSKDGAEDRFDLVPSLFYGVNVSLGRTTLETWTWGWKRGSGKGDSGDAARKDAHQGMCMLDDKPQDQTRV
jgi:hypothetical protein